MATACKLIVSCDIGQVAEGSSQPRTYSEVQTHTHRQDQYRHEQNACMHACDTGIWDAMHLVRHDARLRFVALALVSVQQLQEVVCTQVAGGLVQSLVVKEGTLQ